MSLLLPSYRGFLPLLLLCLCIFQLSFGFQQLPKNPAFQKTWSVGGPLHISPQQLGVFEALEEKETALDSRQVSLYDLSGCDRYIPFEEAWGWQKAIMEGHFQRMADRPEATQFVSNDDALTGIQSGVDTILMLQHTPVYTLGTGSDEKFIRMQTEDVATVRMDRGGEVTYHGPGQLTVYPILDLRSYKQDIHWYMRALEEAILLALEKCGVQQAERENDITGVWVHDTKVAAVGIKCRKWVTMHGLAVNVESTCLQNFQGIVPCGLEGRRVGCINQFLEKPITVDEFAGYMKQALAEVFQIKLVHMNVDF